MNYRTLVILLGFPGLLPAQTPIPSPNPPHHAKSAAKVKTPALGSRFSLPPLRVPETQTRLMDQAYYDNLNLFLSTNYSMGKNPQASGDPLLGIAGSVASGVCAGVAAVQWLDAQGKNSKKTNDKPANPAAKAL